LESIASFSDGAMRDAISLLDQARSSIQGRIERDDVLALAGITQDDFMLNVASAVIKGNAASVLSYINELVMSGKDLTRFISDLAQFYRNVLICQVSDKPQKLIQASDALIGQMMSIAQHTRYQLLIRLIQQLSEMMTDLKWASDARTLMEIGLIRIMSELNPEMIDLSGNDASGIADSIKNDHSETNADTAAAAVVSAIADTTVTTAAVVINTDTDADAELNYPEEINDSFAGLEAPEFFDPENITLDSPEDALETDNKKTGSTVEIIRSTNPAEINQAELWQKVLDGLQRSGEMIMYLFGKTAAVRQCNDEFHIIFDQKDQVHFEEFSKESSRSIVNRLLRENCEIDLKLIVSIAEDPELAASQACAVVEESWIKQIRETADQFGIPVNVEE
jgi:DNA polymerase III gamma/tau subunit